MTGLTMDSTQILDGKGLSEAIKKEIAVEVRDWVAAANRRPWPPCSLERTARAAPMDHKVRSCAKVGFESTLIQRPADITGRADRYCPQPQ